MIERCILICPECGRIKDDRDAPWCSGRTVRHTLTHCVETKVRIALPVPPGMAVLKVVVNSHVLRPGRIRMTFDFNDKHGGHLDLDPQAWQYLGTALILGVEKLEGVTLTLNPLSAEDLERMEAWTFRKTYRP